MSELFLENVSYVYKGSDRRAVNNVTAHFEEGKINVVIGPSGSGKTTLLSIIAGLDTPTEGYAWLDGEKLSDMDLDQYRREKVSMIFQAFHLFPLLTVIENVCFPMELNGVRKQDSLVRAKIFLESLGITEEKHKRYPGNLSGGEQQRVAIARTLASGARVILADEPTGNLDKANGQTIVDILKTLAHDQEFCVILVTHDPEIAAQADRIWRMEDGKMM